MWEYHSVLISDKLIDDEFQWVLIIRGTQVLGINNILNHYGSHGFELVSFLPERWDNLGNDEFAVKWYRAVFKRPK